MDWSNEKILQFLELYKAHPIIWDPRHPSNKCKSKHGQSWIKISNAMGEGATVLELKRKKESLMSAYRSRRMRIKKAEMTGGYSYKPTWFAYDLMHSFLGDIYKCKEDNSDVMDEDTMVEEYLVFDELNDPISVQEVHQRIPSKEKRSRSPYASESGSMTLTSTTPQRERPYTSNLNHAKRQMDQALSILKRAADAPSTKEEDECTIFGKLVANKMRKLSDDRRDYMMVKINQLFYDERQGLQ